MTGRERLQEFPVSQRLRLAFIDHCLSTVGGVNRSDLISAFGISAPAASMDLTRFSELFSWRILYDPREKRYRPRHQGPSAFTNREMKIAFDVADAFVRGMHLTIQGAK